MTPLIALGSVDAVQYYLFTSLLPGMDMCAYD